MRPLSTRVGPLRAAVRRPPSAGRRLALLGCVLLAPLLAGSSFPLAAPLRPDGNKVTYPRLIPESKVMPVYPEAAREQKAEGSVILEARIEKDGSVVAPEVLRSDVPDLGFEEAAIHAVGQWRYEPALEDGEPVPVYFTIVVEFRLGQDEDSGAATGSLDAAAPDPPAHEGKILWQFDTGG